ncbi:MAG: hypothetical protein ACOY5B_02415 [Spirochaetota bacterium]
MKKTLLIMMIAASALFAGSKEKGAQCNMDIECAFGLECSSGVCTKKKEFEFGGAGKSGKKCNIDADCIGSGKCEKNAFGKGVCTGN